VVELSGGTSNLFESQGGTVVVHGRSYTASTGVGTVGGELYGGAHLVKRTGPVTVTLGSDIVPMDLPTDVFESGHYLTVLGAGIQTKVRKANVFGFAGATSTNFDSPFFAGVQVQTPAAILFVTEGLTPKWTSSTKIIVSPRVTSLQSFAWNSRQGTAFAVSGGLGSSYPYLASSMSMVRPRYEMKAAYIVAGSQFRRANVLTPLTSEPDRENILLTVRPARAFSFSMGRQNYLSPIYQSNDSLKSVVNQVSGNVAYAGIAVSALMFQSTSGTDSDTAMAFMASRAITTKVNVQATYPSALSRIDPGMLSRIDPPGV